MAEPKSPVGPNRNASVEDDSGSVPPRRDSGTVSAPQQRPSGIVELGLIDGRYKILRELGAGGMGVVHLAEDVDLGRRVAIKVLSPKLATSPDAIGQLQREARGLAALRNPNVVAVHSFG